MKVVCRPDENLLGFRIPFLKLGFDFAMWDGKKPEFDIFDEEHPNIVLANSHDCTSTFVKCLNENKHTIAILFDKDQYKHSLNPLEWKFYIIPEREEDLDIDNLNLQSLKYVILPPLVDINSFYPVNKDEAFECDLGVYGPPNQIVYAMCYPVGELNIKVFGPYSWNVPQYMGSITHEDRLRLYSSAKACWTSSIEEALKICACKGFPVTDNMHIQDLLGEEVDYGYHENLKVAQKSALSEIYYEKVLKEHTYEIGMKKLLETLND